MAIIDINRNSISSTTMFHFNYSLRPFILTETLEGDFIFVDLTQNSCFKWEELEFFDLKFYTKEEDENFCGVEIIGEINY